VIFLRRGGPVQRRCQVLPHQYRGFEYRENWASRPATWGRSAHSG